MLCARFRLLQKRGHVITFVVSSFKAIPSLAKTCLAACELIKRRQNQQFKSERRPTIEIKTHSTNLWITKQLNIGTSDVVSRYVSEFRKAAGSLPQR